MHYYLFMSNIPELRRGIRLARKLVGWGSVEAETVQRERVKRVVDVMLQSCLGTFENEMPQELVDQLGAKMLELLTNGDDLKREQRAAIKRYARNFTADELQQIVDFRETPVGKKIRRFEPTFSAEAVKLGVDAAGRLKPTVRAAMMEIIEKYEADHPDFGMGGQ